MRLAPGSFTDSVDSDDGVMDGSGLAGSSYFSNGATSTFEFVFDGASLGGLPTHAGLVWTDVGDVLAGSPGIGLVRFEAFDAVGVSLGDHGPFTLGDGSATGATAEDRFFGITHPAGISRITITMPDSVDWEVDHVQYGLIPAPGAAVLMLGTAGWCGRRRRFR